MTPLHVAVMYDQRVMVQELLKLGASPETKDMVLLHKLRLVIIFIVIILVAWEITYRLGYH
jgi:hypothetical protein